LSEWHYTCFNLPDEADALACVDIEIDVLQNGLDAELFVEVMDTKREIAAQRGKLGECFRVHVDEWIQ
jgi:hypothetical protein